MRLLDAQLPPDINIYSFGDTHEEYIGCYEDGINQFVATVHDDPMGYVIFGGDAFETQYPTHKYYDPRTLRKNSEQNPITVGEQVKLSAIKYLPIKDRILAWHIGNHELRVIGVINLGQALLSELDIPHVYAGYSSKVAIKDSKGKKWFKIYTNHGTNMAQSRAGSERQKQTNQAVSLINRLAPLTGDCLVMQMFHCLDDNTEILTTQGWKTREQLLPSDQAITLNTHTNIAEPNSINGIFIHENKYDTVLQCHSSSVDFAVTEDHQIYYRNSKQYNYQKPGRSFPKGVYKHSNGFRCEITRNRKKVVSKVFKTVREAEAFYKLQKDNYFQLFSSDTALARSKTFNRIPVAGCSGKEDFALPDNWIRLLGWLISEGHFRNNGSIQLFQRVSKSESIRNLLQSIGISFTEYYRKFAGREFQCPHTGKTYTAKEDSITFYIGVDDAKKIHQFISSKSIPSFTREFSDRQFDVFLDALIQGDGYWQKQGRSGTYYSADLELLDDLQALAVTHGWRCYLKKGKHNQSLLGLCKRNIACVSSKNWSHIPATRFVWCVNVDNGTIFTRRNGKVVIVGNTHRLIAVNPLRRLYLVDDGRKIKQKYITTKPSDDYIDPENRFYINGGSFFRSQVVGGDTYAERAMYPPTEMGYAKITVRDYQVVDVEKVTI